MAFSFGAVWGRFFKLIGENFAAFALIALLFVLLPTLIWRTGMYEGFNLTNTNWPQRIGLLGPAAIISGAGGGVIVWLLGLVNLCAITEIAILRAVGKPVKLGETIGHAVGNMIPVFIISLIVAIITTLGFMLFIIPGVMFVLAAYVAIPAYVGEKGRGLWGSVKRSFELTKGHRWLLLGISIVWFIAIWIVAMLATAPMIGEMMLHTQSSGVMTVVYSSVAAAIVQILTCVFTAAIYVSLRESKDKLSPQQTANVF